MEDLQQVPSTISANLWEINDSPILPPNYDKIDIYIYPSKYLSTLTTRIIDIYRPHSLQEFPPSGIVYKP